MLFLMNRCILQDSFWMKCEPFSSAAFSMGVKVEIVTDNVRLDKWLWAARFFKTRSLAAQAVTGGKVHVDGQRAKPARSVRVGNILRITCNTVCFVITVLIVLERRGPAAQARLMYEESSESVKAREEQRELRRLIQSGFVAEGRPD